MARFQVVLCVVVAVVTASADKSTLSTSLSTTLSTKPSTTLSPTPSTTLSTTSAPATPTTPTTQAVPTTTPTLAPTLAPASVFDIIRVEGIDYNLLKNNPQMLTAFESMSKISMHTSSGYEVANVRIRSGSVVVMFEVRVPPGSAQDSIHILLQRNSDRITTTMEQAIRSLPGIDSVSVGLISVTHCGVENDERLNQQQSCLPIPEVVPVVAPVQQVPVQQASMPADLNWATQLAKLQPGSGSAVHTVTPWYLALAAVALMGLFAFLAHRANAPVEARLLADAGPEE